MHIHIVHSVADFEAAERLKLSFGQVAIDEQVFGAVGFLKEFFHPVDS